MTNDILIVAAVISVGATVPVLRFASDRRSDLPMPQPAVTPTVATLLRRSLAAWSASP